MSLTCTLRNLTEQGWETDGCLCILCLPSVDGAKREPDEFQCHCPKSLAHCLESEADGRDPCLTLSGERLQLGESRKERKKEKVTWPSGQSRHFASGDVSWSSSQENKGSRGFPPPKEQIIKKEPRCFETILVASGLPDGGMMKRAETVG